MPLENLFLTVFAALGLAGIIWRLRRRMRDAEDEQTGAEVRELEDDPEDEPEDELEDESAGEDEKN